jgi:NTE family protein
VTLSKPGVQSARTLAERLCCLLAASLLSACATTRPWGNEPLADREVVVYDGRAQLVDRSRNPDLLVVASFSGGGSRAAAFAHAVLGELRSETFLWHGKPTNLAAEIDVLAGVSGGSITAAHLALHGLDESLRRFPAEFLATDFQGSLVRSMLSPSNLVRTTSPWFGRGHVLAETFDGALFNGATFGTLAALPSRPYLMIGATDLATGADFDFTSEQLGRLCSSIDRVPLAFAVAASSAVPVLFSPLTLHSHSSLCAQRGLLAPPQPAEMADSARVRMIKQEQNALGHPGRRYIHLVDGGIADNLGTRRITDYVAQAGGIGPVLRSLGLVEEGGRSVPRRIVFIAVNAERELRLGMDSSDEVPSTWEVLDALVYAGLGRSSKETSLVFSDAVAQWRREIQTTPGLGSDADIYSIELKLSDISDPSLGERLRTIPTSFRIDPDQLGDLRQAAKASLAASAEFQRLRSSVEPR